MAWSDIGDIASGAVVTEGYLDQMRANQLETAPGLAVAKGDLFVATAANAMARLAIGANGSTLVPDSGEATGLAWQIVPSCRVYNNAAIDPATSTWVALTFNAERWDSNGMHSVAADTSRITIPAGGGGIYGIGGGAQLDTSGVGGGTAYYGLRILLNSATVICQWGPMELTMNTHDLGLAISTKYNLAATNVVELQIYTTVDVNVLSTNGFSPEFGATWLRRAP